jgi:hypothetical protein
LHFKIIGASKKFKNQPRPLVRPSSVNFCQKFWNLSHETVPLKRHFRIIPYSKQVYGLPHAKSVLPHTGDRDQGFHQRKVPVICTVSVSADGRRLGGTGHVVQWGYCPLCTQKPNRESTWTNRLYLVNGKYKEALSCMSLWFTLATCTSERCEARGGIFKLKI